jgi:hypothetical protein
MKIDEFGCLVMEHSSPEGNLGDSCAETGRLEHMLMVLGEPSQCSMFPFLTDKGYVRHPNAIWREDDFSSDQALPFYLVTKNRPLGIQMHQRIQAAGWKTGNGTFVSPGFYALLKDSQFLINQTLAAQALIFKFPWRWSDSKKWFEKSEGSSADYLNWIHAAAYAYPWVRNMIPKQRLKDKVIDYYDSEPYSIWVVELYERFIDLHFQG